MNDISTVIEDIKTIISYETRENRKFKDADVAKALGVTSQYLATCKNRGKILFKEIIAFCEVRGLSLNKLLLNQDADFVAKKTNAYEFFKLSLTI